MKNFVESGEYLSLAAAPYAVTSGQGVHVTAIFGIAVADALISTPVEIVTKGVFDITKEPALAIALGARVFWDPTNRRITTVTTSAFCVGICVAAALAGDSTVRVLLDRASVVAV